MLQAVLDIFRQSGLQAFSLNPDTMQILIGDLSPPGWSCVIEIMYLTGETTDTSRPFCKALDGPNKGKVFRISKLLEEDAFSTWQFLGGSGLPNADRIKTFRMNMVSGGGK